MCSFKVALLTIHKAAWCIISVVSVRLSVSVCTYVCMYVKQ